MRILLLAVMVIGLVLVSGCVQPVQLEGVEVREYEGENLASIQDFRENSIKGPQYINIDNYTLEITGLVENTKSYTYQEVISRQSYTKVVTLNCIEGWSVKILWEASCWGI